MDLSKLIKLFLDQNKVQKFNKQIGKVQDYAKKAEKNAKGKVNPADLKLFANKNINLAFKSTYQTQKHLKRLLSTPFRGPESDRTERYMAMMDAAKRHGTSSKQFAKAQRDYKVVLKYYETDLVKLEETLRTSAAKYKSGAQDYAKVASRCSNLSVTFTKIANMPDYLSLNGAFVAIGQSVATLAGLMVDISKQLSALHKRHTKFAGWVRATIKQNKAWIKKDFTSEAELYLNMERATPK